MMDLLLKRRVMMNGLLPPLYKRLEYLKSDSSAYIDTGIAGGKTTLEIGIEFLYSTYVNNGQIYGNFIDIQTKNDRLVLYTRDNGIVVSFYSRPQNSNMVYNILPNVRHTVISSYNSTIVDNTTYQTAHSSDTTSNTTNIALFARNVSSPAIDRNIGLQIYSFSIKDSGALIQNLIPCRRKSDGELGMYDTVTGNFLTNIGPGSFIAGPDIV